VRATLDAAVARSPSTSQIVMTCSLPTALPLLRNVIFGGLCGELQVGRRTPEQMARLVRASGLTLEEDTGLADWARRFRGAPAAARFGLRAVLASVP
jgi:hypothetical protein